MLLRVRGMLLRKLRRKETARGDKQEFVTSLLKNSQQCLKK